LSLQSITDPSTHTKNVTPQGHVFTESFEQGTENPRVENSVITPVNMRPEGSDLIGSFLWLKVFVEGDIPVLENSFHQSSSLPINHAYFSHKQK
jgi:hypothetical protein